MDVSLSGNIYGEEHPHTRTVKEWLDRLSVE